MCVYAYAREIFKLKEKFLKRKNCKKKKCFRYRKIRYICHEKAQKCTERAP